MAANAAVSPSNAACTNYNIFFRLRACLVPISHPTYKSVVKGYGVTTLTQNKIFYSINQELPLL
jgi:hypothetical protein